MTDDDVRLDKWLWAARFYKTRALAQAAVENGRVLVGGDRVKVARPVRIGDEIRVRTGDIDRTVRVRALSDRRGSAPIAQQLYEETPESIRSRVADLARRSLYREPSSSIESGRPSKRDRRRLDRVREGD